MSNNPVLKELLVRFDHVLEESADEFGTQHWQSVLWNLHNVRPEDWDGQPTPNSRTIREIVMHIGIVFLAYENHIFGDGTRGWDDPSIDGVSPDPDPESTLAWLRKAHATIRSRFAELNDEQLNELTPWGAPWTYGRVLEINTQHPTYHIGEINYARSILQNNNDWMHMDLGREDLAEG